MSYVGTIFTYYTYVHSKHDDSQVCLLELGLVLLSHRPPNDCVTRPITTSDSRPGTDSFSRPDTKTDLTPEADTETNDRSQPMISRVSCLAKWVEDVVAGRVRPTLTSTNRVQLKYLYRNLNGIL